MDVAVAIIIDQSQRVLIAQRPLDKSHGGMWEFPGGKVEENESPRMALQREIKEEVNLEIMDCISIGAINHYYATLAVRLFVFYVTSFKGHAIPNENQLGLKWVHWVDLNQYHFPEANEKIITLIQERHSVLPGITKGKFRLNLTDC
ncbi:(deoxy)nucleoside triphosphate pyrophosphohydrolase [Legionella yabuuchiae]|uniref:(deoxy)nucleoside triphosphate pyrophosphohydrolase n=1 Tax=Legionella yabuuchiae TaxID=376727 RepID=UPI0010548BD0|nr:(deoxy)nucleoside triphosphate pyrophosphohydrolase [Legionella yabuuchiae]